MHISLDLISLGNEEAYVGWNGKLNSHLMESCVRNTCTKKWLKSVADFVANFSRALQRTKFH